MSNKTQWHVVPREEGWAVRRAVAQRDSSHHRTQGAAEEAAQGTARREGGEVVTHRPDGRIRGKDSYGNDPNPPRDTEH